MHSNKEEAYIEEIAWRTLRDDLPIGLLYLAGCAWVIYATIHTLGII